MSHVLLDASAAIKLVTNEPGSERARGLYRDVETLSLPDWARLEVANALWKMQARGHTTSASALLSFEDLEQLHLRVTPALDLSERALALALEIQHPVYDCLYLVLALDEGAALATADAKLAEHARALGIDVAWIDSAP